MARLNIALLVIDPQIDFMPLPGSKLPVAGGLDDMERLAAFVDRVGPKITQIAVTLDSHHKFHIANPGMWVNSRGENPPPFTLISVPDLNNGTWAPNPLLSTADQEWARKYVEELALQSRQVLVIWPPHCLIGSVGYAVEPGLFAALDRWVSLNNKPRLINFVTKGSNYRTEHYSAVKAEVADPTDPTTQVNLSRGGLISTLQDADIVLLAGEALSHCVANTVRDIAANFDPANIAKLHLLRDCTSPVPNSPGGPDFVKMGEDFVDEMRAKGMKVVDSRTFML